MERGSGTTARRLEQFCLENNHCRRKDHCTTALQLNKIGFDQKKKIYDDQYVGSEADECKHVKLETSSSVKLPLTVSVLCFNRAFIYCKL